MGEFIIQSNAWDLTTDTPANLIWASSSALKHRGFGLVSGVEDTILKKVRFYAKKNGSGVAGNQWCQIWETENVVNSTFTTAPKTKLAEVAVGDWQTDWELKEIDFSAFNITFVPLKTYYVVLYSDTYGTTSNYIALKKWDTEGETFPCHQMGQGEARNNAVCYSADGISWSNDISNTWPVMKVTGTHDTTKVLWSNNSTVLDKDNRVRFGYDASEFEVGWKITTPDDGKYRQLENIAAGITCYDYVANYHIVSISIHEDIQTDSTSYPGEIIDNGIITMSRAAFYAGTALSHGMPTMLRWMDSNLRPVLNPNTKYWFMIHPGYMATTDFIHVPTDSTNGGDGQLYLFDRNGNSYARDNWALFYIHGKELDSNPNIDAYKYPFVNYTTSPPHYVLTKILGASGNGQNQGYAFKSDINCTLSKLRIWVRRNNTPIPMKLSIWGSSGNDLGSLLLDVGNIADSTSSDELYNPRWYHQREIDLGNTVSITAGTKYWIVFTQETYNASHYWEIHECGLTGTRYIGTPYTDDVKCSFYDNNNDLSSPTYEDDSCIMDIIGRVSSGGIETLLNEKSLGSTWGSPGSYLKRFFYNNTERYMIQKIRTPNRSNPMQIYTMGLPCMIGGAYSTTNYDVWAEIRTVGDGDAVGSIVTNGTSSGVNDAHPPLIGTTHLTFTQFSWTTPPELQPDTDYWIILKSTWVDATDAWKIMYSPDSSLRHTRGRIGQGLYIVDSNMLNPVPVGTGGSNNVHSLIINGIETIPIIGPPRDSIFINHLTNRKDQDTTLAWPFTTNIGNQDTVLLWKIFTSAEIDLGIVWSILLSSDTVLLWRFEELPVADFGLPWNIFTAANKDIILPWGIQVSTDTITPWKLMTLAQRDWVMKNVILNENLSNDTRLIWTFLLQSDNIFNWDIWEKKSSDMILRWPLTYLFSQDFILRWKIFITQESTLIWSLTFPIYDVDILNIPIALSSETVLPIGLMGELSSTSTLPWNIEAKIYEDFMMRNSLFMSSDTIIKYSLRDVTNRIWKIVNEISAKIYRDTGVSYAIKIERDCILLIPIRGLVTRDFIIRHGLLAGVDKAHVLKFDLLNYNPVETETIIRNALLGKPRFYKIIFS